MAIKVIDGDVAGPGVIRERIHCGQILIGTFARFSGENSANSY